MQGAQGQWNPASKGQLASDLECENKDEALEIVLREGGKQMGSDRLAKGLKDKYSSTKWVAFIVFPYFPMCLTSSLMLAHSCSDANAGANVVSSGAMQGGRGGR